MAVGTLTRRPEQYAHFPARGYRYLRLFDERGDYGAAAIGEHPDCLEVHLELTRWGPNVLRSLRADMDWLRDYARKRGKKRLVGIRQEDGDPDPRWPKFTRLFGFTGHAVVQTAFAELDEPDATDTPPAP